MTTSASIDFFLRLESALARPGASTNSGQRALVRRRRGAQVIALPESEIQPSQVAERLRDAYRRGKTHALAVIAEGAKCGVHELMEYYAARRAEIGFELRVTRLGHVVRGGAPGAADRVLATRLGAAAIETLAAGTQGVLVGIVKNDVIATPLAEIAGRTRPADASLLELARVMAI